MNLKALAPALLLFVSSLAAQDDDSEVPTSQLMEDAARVVLMARVGDNIEAGRQAETVYRAAKRLLNEKKYSEARTYYESALQLSPWSVSHYTDYAETLAHLDQKEKATRWAKAALDRAEDFASREKARLWLNEKPPERLPAYSPPNEGIVICIVRIGHPPEWLVHRCGIGLENVLGVPVMLLGDLVAMPPSTRSAFHRWAGSLREGVKWEDPQLKAFLRAKGYPEGRLTDEEVVRLVEEIIKESRPEEELIQFRKNKRQLSEPGRDTQWEVGKLIDILAKHATQEGNNRVIWLGLTDGDLYMGDSNYCFGAGSSPPACIINSCARFTAAFNGEPPDANRLCERLLKQMLSSVGTLLGAKRPIDPTCPRSYPQSLAEQDAKTLNLCDDCRASIATRIGKELPQLPKDIFERPKPPAEAARAK